MKDSKFSQFASHAINSNEARNVKGGEAFFCTHSDGSEHIYAGYDSATQVQVENPNVSITSCEQMPGLDEQ